MAAVARSECTHGPLTSALMPVSRPYLRTMFRNTDAGSSGLSSFSSVRLFLTGGEEGAGHVFAVARKGQVFLDQALRRGMHGYEPDLVALAFHPEKHHALTGACTGIVG